MELILKMLFRYFMGQKEKSESVKTLELTIKRNKTHLKRGFNKYQKKMLLTILEAADSIKEESNFECFIAGCEIGF
ncbi:MAG: hypothetical protein FWE91_07350 [Defluviitaleaceae bacterium]|nr:hypothetical protein [Defluviitaleaceae bacterium]MCL2837057.1 hypothetical protein [Defluviitaleaceae bacterium]